MTEAEAHDWLAARPVSRGTIDKLAAFIELLKIEAARQNLIARSTFNEIWARHVVDSAQLLDQAGAWRSWLDLGTGAGFPGLIIAALSNGHVTLVDERRKRIDFLTKAAELLGVIDRVTLRHQRVETLLPGKYEVVSARAFAPLDRLLPLALHAAGTDARLLLPKGRSAPEELAAARRSWQGEFSLVPSITDPDASIIVARRIAPRRSA